MKLNTNLNDLQKTISLCIRCGMCTYGEWPECSNLCSIYNHHRIFTASAGGLVYLVRAIAEKKIGYTQKMAEYAYECNLCEACDMCEIISVPAPHTTPSEIIRYLRAQLVKRGIVPKRIKNMQKKFKEALENKDKENDLDNAESRNNENANYVLFFESPNNDNFDNTKISAIRLLEKMKIPIAFFNENLSAYEMYDLGFWDELSIYIKRNKKKLEKIKHKTVIFTNPHSQEFMTKRYPEISKKNFKINAKNLSEILNVGFKNGDLRSKGNRVSVSYHDPCHMIRGLRLQDEPRELLNFVGAELIEMKRNRGNTICCGAGGSAQKNHECSNAAAKERIGEFMETKADLLITNCPLCKENFKKALPFKEQYRVKDLIEYVYENTE